MIIAHSKQEAWRKVNLVFPTDYQQDNASSTRAGDPVYRSTAEGHHYDYICDLGSSLEVNLASGKTIRIAIAEPETETEFIGDGLTVIDGRVCIPLCVAAGRRLARAFQHAGTWYIAEQDARLTQLTPAGGCVYRAALRNPA